MKGGIDLLRGRGLEARRHGLARRQLEAVALRERRHGLQRRLDILAEPLVRKLAEPLLADLRSAVVDQPVDAPDLLDHLLVRGKRAEPVDLGDYAHSWSSEPPERAL